MGRNKKHKLRKAKEVSESSDEESREVPRCNHIYMGVNVAAMKKGLIKQVYGECSSCTKDLVRETSEDRETSIGAEAVTTKVEVTLWVCLQCGNQGCDGNSRDKHALKYYETPRSSCHCLVVNTTSWTVWCYKCDREVQLARSKRLQECVDAIRKQGRIGASDTEMKASCDPLSMAQDVVRCFLCEVAPAELNCNTCHVGLCYECVSKHLEAKKSSKHDISPFIDKKSEILLPECKLHSKLKCDLHCRQCNSVVCLKCISSGIHKSHDLVEISDIHPAMIEAIQQENIALETVIAEEYEKIIVETKKKISKLQSEYQNLKKSVAEHGKIWHEELDIVIARIVKDVAGRENDDLSTLKKQLEDMENILSEIRNTALKNKQILNSKDYYQIINHKSRKEEFLKVPTRVELSPPTFKPLRIEGLNLMKRFGTLTSSIRTELSEYNIKMKESISSLTSVTQLLDVPTEVTTTETGDICSMTTVNTDQMWIGRYVGFLRDGRIDRVDTHGATLETISTLYGFSPWGMTETQEGQLIYTDWKDKTMNLVRRGKIETVIRKGDWIPTSVCSTSNRDLLVCLYKDKQHKVVRYSGYEIKQEIQHDEKNKPLFAKGDDYLRIAENRDHNVCVSDPNVHTALVLNQAGKLQFRYDDNLASNKYKSFDPRGIATDSQSQILIADKENNCVHIINRDGKFLRYIDNCHLYNPVHLSVDSSDRLYVADKPSRRGFPTEIKLIKYLK